MALGWEIEGAGDMEGGARRDVERAVAVDATGEMDGEVCERVDGTTAGSPPSPIWVGAGETPDRPRWSSA